MKLKTNHLLTGDELTALELENLLELSSQLKCDRSSYSNYLKYKHIALLFDKPSLRTRISFAVAINELGGSSIESINQMRKEEEPQDLIRVLQGYCDAIMVRTYDESFLESMLPFAKIPVINGLTNLFHPCQILADLLTLKEKFSTIKGLKICYVGDGNNILHSLLLMATKLGIHINYCCPEQYGPHKDVLNILEANGMSQFVNSYHNPKDAVKHCQAVYTDVWTSMGFDVRDKNAFEDYQVDETLMMHAEKEALFMHCMPMNRGEEVSQTLPDHACSVIFDQSENRLHVQKALLIGLLGDNNA